MTKNPITKLNELLSSLGSYEFSTLAFVIGVILSEGLNANQLNSIGNFYELIGQTLLTIQSQVQTNQTPSDYLSINNVIDGLKNKVGNIEEIIANFKNL